MLSRSWIAAPGTLEDIVKFYDLHDHHEVDSRALTANLSNTHLDGPTLRS